MIPTVYDAAWHLTNKIKLNIRLRLKTLVDSGMVEVW
jgi:hypothetical protein